MKCYRRLLVALLIGALAIRFTFPVLACGPDILSPVYVFTESPDPPFTSFVNGNIGVVRNTFGRKTLFVAYRYLQGSSFTAEEQRGLIDALKGKPPEVDNDAAIQSWIKSRNAVAQEKTVPDIYDDKRQGGYDYFPNCTKNAFEVASQTLADRVARFGSDDAGVQEWLNGQDIVFASCSSNSNAPPELGAGSPEWLRKDREYQIGASYFYQLKFKEARSQFEKIAADSHSSWQETASYLIGRTLVREASLSANDQTRQPLYEQAENYLINFAGSAGKFRDATLKLLALVRFRLHPEEREMELAQILANQTGNENLGQDLIDYTWLLSKFDEQVRLAEEEQQKLNNPAATSSTYTQEMSEEEKQRVQKLEAGELIEVWFTPDTEGTPDYTSKSFTFSYDASDATILQSVEASLGRKLSVREAAELSEHHRDALDIRRYNLNPNRKWSNSNYEGCEYEYKLKSLAAVPAFLRSTDLTDWILTMQSEDPQTYAHALERWRATNSSHWLVAALTHAVTSSPGLQRILTQAAQIQADSPAFPTLAFERVRLKVALGRKLEARKVLDQVITNQFDSLPVSSQNLFFQQRMELAETFSDFLRFAVRKPAGFYKYGVFGSIRDVLETEKRLVSENFPESERAEAEKALAQSAREFLPWEGRLVFDDDTAEMINWHFSTADFVQGSKDPALPDYLQRQFAFTAWTRAVLTGKDESARETAARLVTIAPEMSEVLSDYLKDKTRQQRADSALYALLKFPGLSPFIASGVPEFKTSEDADYYFEFGWWCTPSNTGYDDNGNEVPKQVAPPAFLKRANSVTSEQERGAIALLGRGKSYLGHRVLEWARRAPQDLRIPEALYIAYKANDSYKYGCDGWENDQDVQREAAKILHEHYPGNSWTMKLDASLSEK